MEHIFNHTQAYNYNWPKTQNDYIYNKTHLEWGYNPSPQRITQKMVKANDVIFNPILQKYNNPTYDSSLHQKEKNDIINTIIKNKDNQLKIEQTYNIITLEDRLKGFENHPDYPAYKDSINRRKNINPYPKPYNIISTLPLSQHHYDKPENRPNYPDTFLTKNKTHYMFGIPRDYDIISTKYKEYDEEKTKIDKEINKIQTAKIFYKNNDYNPIKGRFFDEDKEKKFQNELEEKKKNWGKDYKNKLPQCAKGQSDIYNLISLKTVDENELNKKLDLENKKKLRYTIRNKVEDFYHNKNLINQDKIKNNIENKFSYQRYEEEDKRQFNIINLNDRPYKEHSKNIHKDGLTEWEKIVNNAGENNTFNTKQLYKSPYDDSEVGKNYDEFKKKREEKLRELKNINEDKIFIRSNNLSKIKSNEINKKRNEIKKEWNKEKFFSQPKNINYYEGDENIKKINYNFEMSKKKETFDNNKEKNERNKKYLTKNALIEK